jgi:hypothetical protein
MSQRKETHNGRDKSGHFRVKRADVDDLQADPAGEDYVRDDVRLGGAIEDTGLHAGERGARISDLVRDNREDVGRIVRGNDSTDGKH